MCEEGLASVCGERRGERGSGTYKITEQNPNSDLAALRNFAFDMNLPRKTPSTSTPATRKEQLLLAVKAECRRGMSKERKD